MDSYVKTFTGIELGFMAWEQVQNERYYLWPGGKQYSRNQAVRGIQLRVVLVIVYIYKCSMLALGASRSACQLYLQNHKSAQPWGKETTPMCVKAVCLSPIYTGLYIRPCWCWGGRLLYSTLISLSQSTSPLPSLLAFPAVIVSIFPFSPKRAAKEGQTEFFPPFLFLLQLKWSHHFHDVM